MHTRALLFIVLGATFVVTSSGFTAEPARLADSAIPVNIGSPKSAVAARFGMPSQIFSPELWIYREFYTDHQAAAQRGFDTLVIVFEGNRVTQMRVVNGEMLSAALEANRRARAGALAVAGPPRGK